MRSAPPISCTGCSCLRVRAAYFVRRAAVGRVAIELDGVDRETIVQDDFSLLEAQNPLRNENCQSSVAGIPGVGGQF
jgi:hypothetical protein